MTEPHNVELSLQRHYGHGALLAAVDKSLIALGKNPAALALGDLAMIDELHIGGRPASLDFFEQCRFAKGMHLFDVGSGLGGPARGCASSRGVTVTGVDLTPEFVEVARNLSQRLGLAGATTFEQGSVLDLASAAGTFDGAYMIHVGMNIADKPRLFGEVRRVLKRGAVFGIYDVMRIGEGALTFPLPWSSAPEASFVETPDSYRSKLVASGFEIAAERDRQAAALDFFAQAARRAQPALEHRGPGWAVKSDNLQAMLKAGIIAPFEIIARAA